jgi:DNA-binding MarR family transcriptional regulator
MAVLELKGPQAIGALAELLCADRTTATRNPAVAEAQSLVSIRPGKGARSRIASITKEGRRTLNKAFVTWRSVQEALTQSIGHQAAEGLRRLSGGPSNRLRTATAGASRP